MSARLARALRSGATWLLLALVHAYRLALAPLLGGACRFEPSCSAYAEQALRAHGPLRGAWLAGRRIARCHPLGAWGYDPVPKGKEGPGGA